MVKYFYPYLTYRPIDWEKALIRTIPKANAARTPPDYQAAIQSILAALDCKERFNWKVRFYG